MQRRLSRSAVSIVATTFAEYFPRHRGRLRRAHCRMESLNFSSLLLKFVEFSIPGWPRITHFRFSAVPCGWPEGLSLAGPKWLNIPQPSPNFTAEHCCSEFILA